MFKCTECGRREEKIASIIDKGVLKNLCSKCYKTEVENAVKKTEQEK